MDTARAQAGRYIESRASGSGQDAQDEGGAENNTDPPTKYPVGGSVGIAESDINNGGRGRGERVVQEAEGE